MKRMAAWIAAMASAAAAQTVPAKWNKPFPAHRVIGNIYYVGTSYLACFLITTREGNILVNSGLEQSVPLIRASIETLGFRFADTKILLESQAHVDHVAGHALVKKLTGAQVFAMAGDAEVIAAGGAGDFQYEQQWRWTPCRVDRILRDGETVVLGDAVLTAHLTPGHTKGCTTWSLKEFVDGKSLRVVIVGGARANPGFRLVDNAKYPQIAEDFKRTFRVLRSLDCDVFLGAHGWYYGMEAKFARMGQSSQNPFVDPGGYREFVAVSEQAFLQELSIQQGRAGVNSKKHSDE